MFLSPQNVYIEILTRKVMLLAGEASGRYEGYEGGVLLNEVGAF